MCWLHFPYCTNNAIHISHICWQMFLHYNILNELLCIYGFFLLTGANNTRHRYIDGLIGPYPEQKVLFEARSPINHVHRISCPLLLLHGDLDKVNEACTRSMISYLYRYPPPPPPLLLLLLLLQPYFTHFLLLSLARTHTFNVTCCVVSYRVVLLCDHWVELLTMQVVPPNQAQDMYAAVAARGLPAGLLIFHGEAHGWRKAETICSALHAELSFYVRVFGLQQQVAPQDLRELPLVNAEALP